MSDHGKESGHESHGHQSHGHESEDQIDFRKVIAVGVVSLVIFAVATWWAVAILHGERAHLKGREEGRVGSELGKMEIGIVDQVPFSKDQRLDVWRARHAEWLSGYNWVDRQHGIVTMPIERAMDAVVAGAAPPAPASSGTAPPHSGGEK
jgi:hypothetical protein